MEMFNAVPIAATKAEVIETIFKAIHKFEDGLSSQQRSYLDEHFPNRILERESVDIGFLKVSHMLGL